MNGVGRGVNEWKLIFVAPRTDPFGHSIRKSIIVLQLCTFIENRRLVIVSSYTYWALVFVRCRRRSDWSEKRCRAVSVFIFVSTIRTRDDDRDGRQPLGRHWPTAHVRHDTVRDNACPIRARYVASDTRSVDVDRQRSRADSTRVLRARSAVDNATVSFGRDFRCARDTVTRVIRLG